MPFTLISRMQEEGGLYFTVIRLLVAIWGTDGSEREMRPQKFSYELSVAAITQFEP